MRSILKLRRIISKLCCFTDFNPNKIVRLTLNPHSRQKRRAKFDQKSQEQGKLFINVSTPKLKDFYVDFAARYVGFHCLVPLTYQVSKI